MPKQEPREQVHQIPLSEIHPFRNHPFKVLDDELMDMLKETLPQDLPVVFISAVTGFGLNELKDVLWEELNSESNKLQTLTSEDVIVHRDKDMSRFAAEMEEEGEDDIVFLGDDEVEDIDDYEYEEELDD